MFLPGDQPLLRRATVDQLLTAFAQTQKETERVIFRLGAPAGNGPDPLVGSPVLFSNGFFPELLTLPEGKGGSQRCTAPTCPPHWRSWKRLSGKRDKIYSA